MFFKPHCDAFNIILQNVPFSSTLSQKPHPSHLDSHLQKAGVPRKANYQSLIGFSKDTTGQGSAERQIGREWVVGSGESSLSV